MKALAERLAAGLPAALATVTGSSGSVPREIGAKMLVFPDGTSLGTIGGGRLEAQVIEDSIKSLHDGKPRNSSYELEPKDLGMYCGGKVDVFIDVFTETLKLIILGGGHVGEKTAALAAFLGVPHWIVDDRPDYATRARFPAARQVVVDQPSAALQSLHPDPNTAIAIVTRCHGFDLRCLVAALPTPAFYIGMIGSRTKIKRLFDLCERRGLEPAADQRVHAPIGLDLGGRAPETIALSIMAEVVAAHRGSPLGQKQPADSGSMKPAA